MREPRTWSKRKSRPSRARSLTRVNTCIFRFFFWMYGYRFSFVTRETRVVFSFLVIFKDSANPHDGSIPYFSLGTVRVSRDKYVSILVIIQWGETFVGRGRSDDDTAKHHQVERHRRRLASPPPRPYFQLECREFLVQPFSFAKRIRFVDSVDRRSIGDAQNINPRSVHEIVKKRESIHGCADNKIGFYSNKYFVFAT